MSVQNRSGYEGFLPVIQESFEESLYDGNLTTEDVEEILDKLAKLQVSYPIIHSRVFILHSFLVSPEIVLR